VKRKLIAAWLLVFAAWPLVQFGLVRAYDIHPWRFGGWATFAVPLLPPNVVLFQIDYRNAKTLQDIKAIKVGPAYWSAGLKADVDHYMTDRANFGRLIPPPELLGKKFLDEHGETGMVLVVVQTRQINRSTGLMETNIERYVYSADRLKPGTENLGAPLL
jgi:hypothetical protein